jgi:hypothetical protein
MPLPRSSCIDLLTWFFQVTWTACSQLIWLCLQIGEIKKGLKALKATGVTSEDYERHVMFVQVGLYLKLLWLHRHLKGMFLTGACNTEKLVAGTQKRTSNAFDGFDAAMIAAALNIDQLCHCRTTCTRCWILTCCLKAAPSGSLT